MTTPHTCDRRFAGGADLERFFDLSTDLLCVAGFDGYFRLLSPSWSRLLGYSDDELTGRPFEDFVHVDDRAPTTALFAAQVEAGAVCIRFVNRYRHKDGSYRTLSWNAAPDAERGLIYAVARCLDEQIESARVIEESEALFRGAFEQSLVGMCLTSPQGRFQRVNPMLAELLGRPAEDLVGMPVAEVTHVDDLEQDADAQQDLLAGRLPGLQRETRYVRPDGTTVAVNLTTTLIRTHDGTPSHFVMQMLDVTRDRAAADALASTAAMLDGIVQNSQSLVYVTRVGSPRSGEDRTAAPLRCSASSGMCRRWSPPRTSSATPRCTTRSRVCRTARC
ncbi:MAG: PAS domain-containing protein [Mycobacteriales bacterium]